MSLDYDKFKGKEKDTDQQWASYSDLFMVLSFIFLLLYVTASLRNGAHTLQTSLDYKEIAHERDDLKEQIRVYNTLKDNYLEKGASKQEQKTYSELMDKLNLLQDEATAEKNDLRKKANENEKKATALNQYQQVIRNIINTNLVAQGRIQKREKIIDQKQETIVSKDKTINKKQKVIRKQSKDIIEKKKIIAHKESIISDKEKLIGQKEKLIAKKQSILNRKKIEISNLNRNIVKKKKTIAANNQAIKNVNSTLSKKIKQLKRTTKNNKTARRRLNKQIKALQVESRKKLSNLNNATIRAKKQLSAVDKKLGSAKNQLVSANRTINKQEKEKQRLEVEMKTTQKKFKRTVASLNQKVVDAKKKVAKAHTAYLASLKKEKEEKRKLSSDLKNAKDKLMARKKIAKRITANFRKAGIKASVDGKTGDVVLAFGKEYFDTGKSYLKESMEGTLKKFMPIYSTSLFADKKISKKIKSVEIIGYSSPTYKGRYIDPNGLRQEDRAAVNYNLDLSYYRAKSIFKYIFDTKKMKYNYQKRLLPLVKVTGRSFLAEGVQGRGLASGISKKEYCKRFNCKKAQKVIIKFNLKD